MEKIPPYMKALVLDGTTCKVETIPTLHVTPGTAVVRVLSFKVNPYAREVYLQGGSDVPSRRYPFPRPMVSGSSAIGRIVAMGSDSTKLQLGDLVFLNYTIRSRDEPADLCLPGTLQGFTAGLIEVGTLKIGPAGGSEIFGKHKLEALNGTFEDAARLSMFGQQVVIAS